MDEKKAQLDLNRILFEKEHAKGEDLRHEREQALVERRLELEEDR